MKSLEETADKCEQDLEKLNRNLEKVKASVSSLHQIARSIILIPAMQPNMFLFVLAMIILV